MFRYIVLPIVGFIVGLLIISLGGGGGAIYVGILTAFFNIPPAIAASTSLATTIPTTAVGSFSHWKAGNVNLHFGLTMLIGGIAGSIIGSLCSGLLPQDMYNKLTGIILVLLAVQMLFSYIRKKKKRDDDMQDNDQAKKSNTIKAVCFGLLGGVMSGLVGLSGGGPIVAGLMILGCQALETVGTSVLVLLGIAVTGFITHLGLGNIDWKLVGLLAVGTMCGAFAGPFLLKRIDKKNLEKVLRPVLFIMTATMGGMLIFK
ncbi:MAG TPA: sulfite exporter TauE/SafE family protein [Clostridium sp.]|uniref:Probable membrane transporter protein n=1 Tax=Clostridium lapidicellarium TaxID=3240931 RepID=A0ABV4DX78_9CLOT|nr:sulfite exporter TauE/SafE family protein [uncultured Clostridium sp.]NLU07662.1 sulfite exporter TauE/SafE family protein [Clostridiales bacterium]HBC96318.1 sulfite exporter TauE/SafE family protein [Clostridium sp.]